MINSPGIIHILKNYSAEQISISEGRVPGKKVMKYCKYIKRERFDVKTSASMSFVLKNWLKSICQFFLKTSNDYLNEKCLENKTNGANNYLLCGIYSSCLLPA